mgnify:CR=1 FL=1
MEILLNNKADPNICDAKKEYPVIEAVKQNKFFFLGLLGKYGANLNVLNEKGETPLIVCVKNSQLDVPIT